MAKAPIKRPAELEYTPQNCHAREMLIRIGDKWSVYVIHLLDEAGTMRFNELRSQVEGISQRMLTVTLRGMERDGLVTRVYRSAARVEYTLTPLRKTLRRWCANPCSGRARSGCRACGMMRGTEDGDIAPPRMLTRSVGAAPSGW
jgi:DNA-binding HxlR family transcriptional regulator